MLSDPGHKLVPNVLLGVAEEYQAICVQSEPIILDLSNRHRFLPPLVGCSGCSLGDLGHDSPGAALGLACTNFVSALGARRRHSQTYCTAPHCGR